MANLQLSPDSLTKMLSQVEDDATKAKIERQKDKPFTGEEPSEVGGYFEDQDRFLGLFNIDRMETPITEEEEDNPIIVQVVNTPEYQNATDSVTRNRMIEQALTAQNMEIFRSKGDAAIGGPGTFLGDKIGAEVRTQRFVDDEGNKETFLVPKPGAEATGFQRVVAGGLLDFGKGIGTAVEEGFNIPFTDVKVPGTDDLGITDPETNYVRENFPTYPPASDLEQVGQDVTAIIAGAATGAGAAKKLDDAVGLSSKGAKYIANMWDDSKKLNPANYKKGLELFLRGFLIERGTNLGATLATPDTAEPLIGDYLLDKIGVDAEENKQLAHYIDNEAFGAAVKTIFLGFRGLGVVKNKLIPSIKLDEKTAQRDLAVMILNDIDPGITNDVPLEELARRTKILGETLGKNETLMSELTQEGTEISLDAGSALLLSTDEYVRKAYAWMEPILGREAFEQRMKEYGAEMANRIVSLKQTVSSTPVVGAADAAVNAQVQATVRQAAEEQIEGGVRAADAQAQARAGEVVEELDELDAALAAAKEGEDVAEASVKATQDRSAITSMLEFERGANRLGSDAAERAALGDLTGEQLFTAWKRSFDNYNDQFKNLPDDAEFDLGAFIEDFKTIFTKENDIGYVTSKATQQDPVGDMLRAFQPRAKIGPDGEPLKEGDEVVMETLEEVAQRLEDSGVSLKYIYTNLRPAISARLNNLEAGPAKGLLTRLKQTIDSFAEQSGDPAFREAMDAYSKHEGIYASSADLAQWENTARNVFAQIDEAGNVKPGENFLGQPVETAAGRPKGMSDALKQGYELIARAEGDQTGVYMEDLLNALRQGGGDDVDATVAGAYAASAIRALFGNAPAGEAVTSQQLRAALGPYINKLENVPNDAGAPFLASFRETIESLEMAEAGLITAKEATENAQLALNTRIAEAQQDAARLFIEDISNTQGLRGVVENPSRAFDSIFKAKNAPDIVEQMLRQAEEAGDPQVLEGLRAQFLKYIGEQIPTAKRLGADISEGAESAVKEASAAKLDRILGRRGGDNTMLIAEKILEPKMYQALEDLLQIQNISLNQRAYRPGAFGSTTPIDLANREKVDRLIVMTLGVLNPLATKARNIGRVVTNVTDARMREVVDTTLENMLANPAYFREALAIAEKSYRPDGLFNITTQYFGRGALGAEKNSENDPVYRAIPPLQ